ncbi:transmembrane protein 208-like [Pollicipes pollicipes]|uniref:transmembrane protein 208-like n=1 Tax=Pollicipes pollicipes TaxID=41117 RepID=UPI0018854AC2|nr:transmembrane protein 208-like [Pollicipes pollicipes]XP_037085925.1 transmembrane protein 208-like [Pollicipes pollicipes]
MAPQKGKVGTKGQKQILEENNQTLNFYRIMILGSNGLFLALNGFVFSEFAYFEVAAFLLVAVVHISCYQFLSYMARPKYSSTGQLADGGLDLNVESGVAEHVKDLVIVTSGCQTLGLISRYFWILWAFVPLRAFHMLWKNVLGPYFFAPAPEEPDVDEKKQRKMARKMRYAAQ